MAGSFQRRVWPLLPPGGGCRTASRNLRAAAMARALGLTRLADRISAQQPYWLRSCLPWPPTGWARACWSPPRLGFLAVRDPDDKRPRVATGVAGLAVATTAFDTATGAAAAGVTQPVPEPQPWWHSPGWQPSSPPASPVGLRLSPGSAPVGFTDDRQDLAAGLVSTLGWPG